MSTPSIAERAPTVWMDGDPQPGREVDTVRDVDGDVWERWMSDDDRYPDMWMTPDDPETGIPWGGLAKEFGPLTDVTNDFIVWDKPATDEPAGEAS